MFEKHPKFAPLTLDSIFKKAFANEQSPNALMFLLNTFLAEKLKSPIKEVSIMNGEQLGKTLLNRKAVFDIYCKDAAGARFIVEVQVKLWLMKYTPQAGLFQSSNLLNNSINSLSLMLDLADFS